VWVQVPPSVPIQ